MGEEFNNWIENLERFVNQAKIIKTKSIKELSNPNNKPIETANLLKGCLALLKRSNEVLGDLAEEFQKVPKGSLPPSYPQIKQFIKDGRLIANDKEYSEVKGSLLTVSEGLFDLIREKALEMEDEDPVKGEWEGLQTEIGNLLDLVSTDPPDVNV